MMQFVPPVRNKDLYLIRNFVRVSVEKEVNSNADENRSKPNNSIEYKILSIQIRYYFQVLDFQLKIFPSYNADFAIGKD